MTAQLHLDEWAPGQRPPRARAADAPSSHAAADRAESSGRLSAAMAQTLEAVRRSPGLSSLELAAAYGMDRHVVAKRLSDLFRRGLVERIEPEDGSDFAWFPPEAAPAPSGASPAVKRRASAFAAALSWDAATSRARAGFRAAGRKASADDLRGAAAIEVRLRRVYRGELVARVLADGRVDVQPAPARDAD